MIVVLMMVIIMIFLQVNSFAASANHMSLSVQQMDGPVLPLQQVSRTHMGAYLCIASNGVPPSVSKRITLDVECKCCQASSDSFWDGLASNTECAVESLSVSLYDLKDSRD